jgi:WD40 repeat protein/serine/threonine protein kinase
MSEQEKREPSRSGSLNPNQNEGTRVARPQSSVNNQTVGTSSQRLGVSTPQASPSQSSKLPAPQSPQASPSQSSKIQGPKIPQASPSQSSKLPAPQAQTSVPLQNSKLPLPPPKLGAVLQPPKPPGESSKAPKSVPKTIDENRVVPPIINKAQSTIDENNFAGEDIILAKPTSIAPIPQPDPEPSARSRKQAPQSSPSENALKVPSLEKSGIKPPPKTVEENDEGPATVMASPSKRINPPQASASQPVKPVDKSAKIVPVMAAQIKEEPSADQTKAAIRPMQVAAESSYRNVPLPDFEDDSGKHTAMRSENPSDVSQQRALAVSADAKPTPLEPIRKPPSRDYEPSMRPDDVSSDPRSAPENSGLLTMTPIYTEAELPDADMSLVSPEERYIEAEEFARGGLGRISRTYDKRLGRYIALKEILLNDSDEVEIRFLQEAQITARLEHPSIVPVYDLGRWRGGGVYFAMKLVNGRSLDKVVNQNSQKKTLPDRIALLPHAIDACEAMAYAHQQRIIHRDLKPQNILVGAFGETVVIDWGIAKEVGTPEEKRSGILQGASGGADMTQAGAILGTPTYMAPEQARGEAVDERTDVYALGAILYYILCGKSPYSGERRKNSAAILGALLDGPPVPLETREPNTPKELLAIVQKAMAREPKDRYPSAKELAADIKKFQTGQIVGAYQYTFAEIVKRFIRKNLIAVVVSSVLAFLLLVGGVFSYISISRSNKSERQARLLAEAETQEKTKRSFALMLGLLRQSVERDPTLAISYAKELLQNENFLDWRRVRTLAADAISRGLPMALGAPWSKGGQGHTLSIVDIDTSPDGKLLVTASDDRSVRLWDLSTGEPKAVLQGHSDEVTAVHFSPDGKLVASSGGNSDQSVRLWDVATGKEKNALIHKTGVKDLVFSPDGNTIASASIDGIVHLWDTASGQEKPLDQEQEGAALAIRFSPNGKFLASYGEDEEHTVRLWTPATSPKPIKLEGHSEAIGAMAFSPDSKWLATGAEDFQVRLWDLSQEKPTSAVLAGHVWKIRALVFSPDSKILVSAGEDKNIRIWRLEACRKAGCASERVLDKHQGSVVALAISPDGKILASAAQDQTVRLWDIESGREINVFRGHTGAINDLVFTPDGKKLISAGDDAIPRVWDLSSIEKGIFAGHKGFVFAAAFSPDGTKLASGGDDSTARIWDVATGKELFALQHDTPIWEAKFSPDGRLLATACDDGLMFLWEVSTGRKLVTLRKHDAAAYGLAFSRDGKILASSSVDMTVKFWDVATGNLIRTMKEHTDEILDLDVSPDNTKFVSASLDGNLIFWNVQTGKVEFKFNAQGKSRKKYSSVSFSPDKKLLAAGNYSSEVEIWRLDDNGLPTGEPKILRAHQGEVEALAFTPDSLSLASASWDGTVRVWEVDTNKWDETWENRVLRSYGKDVDAVTFSPDGKLIAFASEDELLHLFSNDLPQDRAALKAYLDQIATPNLSEQP